MDGLQEQGLTPMQSEKSKVLVKSLSQMCDEMISSFYLAASSGLVANKMACIEFSFRFIYDTTRCYNLVPRTSPLMTSVNGAVQRLNNDAESVESVFGVLFNALQQYKLLLKSWSDEINRVDLD